MSTNLQIICVVGVYMMSTLLLTSTGYKIVRNEKGNIILFDKHNIAYMIIKNNVYRIITFINVHVF